MTYDSIYIALHRFANYQVWGILLCRLLAPLVFVALLWISRIVSSVMLKFFSVLIAMMLYFFPAIINVFV